MFAALPLLSSAFFLGLFFLVDAVPVQPVQFLAVAPPVTNPLDSTVWHSPSTQNVTWDPTGVPPEAQNYVVTILLGYLQDGDEHLDIKHPLATQVPIMQGIATVTVPANLTLRDDYVVAVIGDSGNVSPTFTIEPADSTD